MTRLSICLRLDFMRTHHNSRACSREWVLGTRNHSLLRVQVSKAPPAHTRPLCRLPPTELPTKRRAARCPRHTFSSNHAAHLVSDPLSATRYPPWPCVEGLDRGATRHLPVARSRVPPLGREAIITIAHQYPLWAQATALSTHA